MNSTSTISDLISTARYFAEVIRRILSVTTPARKYYTPHFRVLIEGGKTLVDARSLQAEVETMQKQEADLQIQLRECTGGGPAQTASDVLQVAQRLFADERLLDVPGVSKSPALSELRGQVCALYLAYEQRVAEWMARAEALLTTCTQHLIDLRLASTALVARADELLAKRFMGELAAGAIKRDVGLFQLDADQKTGQELARLVDQVRRSRLFAQRLDELRPQYCSQRRA